MVMSLFLNIGLVYVFLIKGKTVDSDDHRMAIEMSEEHTDFVLKEMREFLEGVQQINEGIIENDARKVIEAGKKSGGSVIQHAPQGLVRTLPLNFKRMGFRTHDIFDEIKVNAETDFDPNKTQKQLNELLVNCTACHQSFKIKTIREE